MVVQVKLACGQVVVLSDGVNSAITIFGCNLFAFFQQQSADTLTAVLF